MIKSGDIISNYFMDIIHKIVSPESSGLYSETFAGCLVNEDR